MCVSTSAKGAVAQEATRTHQINNTTNNNANIDGNHKAPSTVNPIYTRAPKAGGAAAERGQNVSQQMGLMGYRNQLPMNVADMELNPLRARQMARESEVGQLSGLSGVNNSNFAGFQKKRNKWAAFGDAVDSSTNSAIDTGLSLYSGGLYKGNNGGGGGGQGGGGGGFFGGGGGGGGGRMSSGMYGFGNGYGGSTSYGGGRGYGDEVYGMGRPSARGGRSYGEEAYGL
jgi:hypothetical protein